MKELDLKNLEEEEGFKIFMFHTALTELKPKNLERMDSAPISLLPKGFDYVHDIIPDIQLELRYFGNDNFIGKFMLKKYPILAKMSTPDRQLGR